MEFSPGDGTHCLLMKMVNTKTERITGWKYRRDAFKDCCCSSLIIALRLSISGNSDSAWGTRCVLAQLSFSRSCLIQDLHLVVSTEHINPLPLAHFPLLNCLILLITILEVNNLTWKCASMFSRNWNHYCTAHAANYKEKNVAWGVCFSFR